MNYERDKVMEYTRALETEVAALRETERHLALQYAVSRVLAESISLDEAIPRILKHIGESFGYRLGAFWDLDPGKEHLRCREIWKRDQVETDAFEKSTLETRFTRGKGLPGRIWESRAPAWITNLFEDKNFPRLQKAAAVGLKSAFGFPVLAGRDLYAVIEFFSTETQTVDEKLLQVVAGIGNQIGIFIQRTKTAEELRSSLSWTHSILKTSLDGIISMDARGRVVEFNPTAERMFGYDRDQAVGQQLGDLVVPPWLRERHYRGLEHYLRTGEGNVIGRRIEITAMRSDGSNFPVELSITRVPDEEPPLFVGYVRDITDRKWAEEMLRKSAEAQQFLSEASRVLATSLDYETTLKSVAKLAVPALADWCIVYIKEEAEGLVRRLAVEHANPAHESLARTIMENFAIDAEAEEGIPRVIRSGESLLYPDASAALLAGDVDRKDSLTRLLEPLQPRSWICVPMTAHDHTFGAISFVTTDSGRRYREEDLELAEDLAHRAALAIDNAKLFDRAQAAIQIRESFLSVASHELKTPLTSILASLELLQRSESLQLSGKAADQRMLALAHRQGKRLQKLVDQLLDLSRIQSSRLRLERSTVNLDELVEGLSEEIRPTLRRHTLTVQKMDRSLHVEGDQLRLEQVLQNLVDNAVKYSPEGGTVTITLERVGNYARVAVTDEGIGIPEDAVTQLFNRFFRAENVDPGQISGMGMGLFIVKEITTLHGGTVEVNSRQGEGSTFTVTLPLVNEEDLAENN